MDAYVVVATKGRPDVVNQLLPYLAAQTMRPRRVFLVAPSEGDLPTGDMPSGVDRLISPKAGLCHQRNRGRSAVLDLARADASRPYFVAFFDDDFRPSADWLARCAGVFAQEPTVVGLTGHVLADGINNQGISGEEADAYLSGSRAPEPHWASGSDRRAIYCLYGCNMAFRDNVIRSCEFDENLPLYGWQEDRDYSGQALRHGQLLYVPDCCGVHLGVKSGRVSGERFGYSQVANAMYLAKKGTMSKRMTIRILGRNLAANVVRSAGEHPLVDYRGRLRGNLQALRDMAYGRCHPTRVVEL